jgi:phosphatidylglycerol---prolipoprotein diacylglyceryl transferase
VTPLAAGAVHTAFEWLAIFVGVRLYLRSSKTSLRSLGDTRNYAVILGCILGAAIGNKAAHWFHHVDNWHLLNESPWLILQGQSIVGGLLGGLIGVELGKRYAGVTDSTGDRFVAPILVGLVIGRIGCFIAGLADDTFGNPTTLPWGVDFGDGVQRHPTQLYDIVFAAGAWMVLRHWRPVLARESGLEFKLMLSGYLLWRLLIDALKPVPYAYPAGLSGLQLICLVALAIYLPMTLRQLAKLEK